MNAYRYPTWASLARDYITIMASSISSEYTFSAAGITISKCCNWLQGDIVEAIKVNKSLKHHNLLFHKVLNMEQVERDLEDAVIDEVVGESAKAVLLSDQFSWDDDMDSAPEVDTTEIMDSNHRLSNKM